MSSFCQKNFKTKEGEQADKEDMLRVLQDLKHVLIRTVYDTTMINSGYVPFLIAINGLLHYTRYFLYSVIRI